MSSSADNLSLETANNQTYNNTKKESIIFKLHVYIVLETRSESMLAPVSPKLEKLVPLLAV